MENPKEFKKENPKADPPEDSQIEKGLKVSDNHGYLAIFEWFNIQTVIRSRRAMCLAWNEWRALNPRDSMNQSKVIFLSFQATSLSNCSYRSVW